MKKKVCLIYTGGTIGMIPTAEGYKPQKGYMRSILSEIHELKADEMPDYDLIEYDPLLDSTNISAKQWIKMAKDIEANYESYDGFVILHGTDTMAYTASALSFMLDGLSKPVVLTGSQIPFSVIRNDARDNLITAVIIAADCNIPEVCLFFSSMLIRGNRATKISSDELKAFSSPNYPLLAEAGVNIEVYTKNIRPAGKALRLTEFKEPQIAVLKVFPGMQTEIIEKLMEKSLKGLVIEGFGTGNIPEKDNTMVEVIKRARENGTVIVVCTQCLKGSAFIGAYAVGRGLAEAGVINGYDMTVEAAVTKLYYLLSSDYDQITIRELMETDLRGEMTLPSSQF